MTIQIKTQSLEKTDYVAKLYNVIQERKRLEKEEKELKQLVKGFMDANVLVAGEYLVKLDPRPRTDLDRVKLKEFLGDDLKHYEKTQTVEYMSVSLVRG